MGLAYSRVLNLQPPKGHCRTACGIGKSMPLLRSIPNLHYTGMWGIPNLIHAHQALLLRLHCLTLAHRFLYVVHKDTAALQPELPGNELAIAIQKECGWQHADAAVALANGFFS